MKTTEMLDSEYLTFTTENISHGSLILINSNSPLTTCPAANELTNIDELLSGLLAPYSGCEDQVMLQKQAATMLLSLLKRVNSNQKITALKGFRSHDSNCSEHQSGLAIDLARTAPFIDKICPDFSGDGTIASFCHMAPQFGFILRYPKGKESITGVDYKPWHFRYVGFPHSMIMAEQHLVLEEYIEMLEKTTSPLKPFVYTQNGARMDIMYISMEDRQKIEISFSDALPYTLSGTNRNGVILTRFRRHF